MRIRYTSPIEKSIVGVWFRERKEYHDIIGATGRRSNGAFSCQEEGLEELPPAEQAASVFSADSTPFLAIVETKEIGFNLVIKYFTVWPFFFFNSVNFENFENHFLANLNFFNGKKNYIPRSWRFELWEMWESLEEKE